MVTKVEKDREITPEQKKQIQDLFPPMVGNIDINEVARQKEVRVLLRQQLEDQNEINRKAERDKKLPVNG